MWLVKPAIVVGVLWYLTKGASAAQGAPKCPPGAIYIPWYGCATVLETTTEPKIGVEVVKTTSECDPSSPIYDPARCVATAGVERLVPMGKRRPGIDAGLGLEPIRI